MHATERQQQHLVMSFAPLYANLLRVLRGCRAKWLAVFLGRSVYACCPWHSIVSIAPYLRRWPGAGDTAAIEGRRLHPPNQCTEALHIGGRAYRCLTCAPCEHLNQYQVCVCTPCAHLTFRLSRHPPCCFVFAGLSLSRPGRMSVIAERTRSIDSSVYRHCKAWSGSRPYR